MNVPINKPLFFKKTVISLVAAAVMLCNLTGCSAVCKNIYSSGGNGTVTLIFVGAQLGVCVTGVLFEKILQDASKPVNTLTATDEEVEISDNEDKNEKTE